MLLDAGAKFNRATFWTHVKPWQMTDKMDAGQRPPRFYVDTKEQPYETDPKSPFELTRVWGRGGKTNVWGRVSLRYSDVDLKARHATAGRSPGRFATRISALTMTESIS